MADVIARVIDWLKSPRQCLPVFLASLFVLYAPRAILQRMGLSALRERYIAWIAILAIVSGAVLLTEASIWLGGTLRDRRARKATRNAEIDFLRSLTPPEKWVLQQYIAQQTDTQYLNSADGVVSGLALKRLIYRSSGLGRITLGGPVFAYNLTPWVREYLNKNPELLSGSFRPSPPPWSRNPLWRL